VRQNDLKSHTIRTLCVCLAGVVLAVAGCRDNPQDRAAKEVHRQIQSALQHSDAVAARQQIQSAVTSHRPEGLAYDSAHLVGGNLTFTAGLSDMAELPLATLDVHKAADAIASLLIESQRYLLDKDRVEKKRALQDAEISELTTLIRGTAEQPGLQARLTAAKDELGELQRQRQVARQEQTAVQAVIDDYQARSEALLKQADLASGDEKLNLQQQAYALRLERTADYVTVQAAENTISIFDDQIALAESRVEALERNLNETQNSIDAIETSLARRLLNEQQAELVQLLSEGQKQINARADAIKEGLASYRQAAEGVVQTFQLAAEQYQKIRAGDARLPATVRQGDSAMYAAITIADRIMFLNETTARLTGTIEAADETLVRGLRERLPLGTDPDDEPIRAMMAFFDQADSAYEEAMSLAQRLADRGREVAVGVLNSRLLALQRQMQMADALAQYELASQTQAKLETLKQQGQADFGSLFTLSEAARLLDEGVYFTPVLPVNVELYFESVRQRLTEWEQLPTPEQKAEAVERHLVEIDELIGAYGDEMARLLEPLRQEMLAAMERGFETTTTQRGPGEPNSLF